jgi:hypothetical protein
MMMDKDTVTWPNVSDTRPNCNHFSRRLMSKNQRRLLLHVPAHDIARANATDTRFNQRLTRADLRDWFFFKTDIRRIVEAGNSHAVIS